MLNIFTGQFADETECSTKICLATSFSAQFYCLEVKVGRKYCCLVGVGWLAKLTVGVIVAYTPKANLSECAQTKASLRKNYSACVRMPGGFLHCCVAVERDLSTETQISSFSTPPSAGILEHSMGARNRVGIGLLYRPARLRRLSPYL
jgi:hypothetical protein